jgi:HK97 gp10 family phage protein
MTPEQTAAKFAAAAAGMKANKPRLMSKIVLVIEKNSKRVTPVRTGNLRRSVGSKVEAGGDRGVIGASAHYARYVHEGTSRMSGRPFFVEGAKASKAEIDTILQGTGLEIVSGIAG